MNELRKHAKSDKIKWIAVAVAIVLLAAALIAVIVKISDKDTTKQIGYTAYKVGRLSDTDGKTLVKDDESGIYMKDYVEVDGLMVELAKDAKITYQINFYDESYKFISVKDMTANLAASDIPATAKYARIEIIPTADKDGKVGLLEVKEYAEMLIVKVKKEGTQPEKQPEQAFYEDSGMLLNCDGPAQFMSLKAEAVAPLSDTVEKSVVLTASVLPADALHKDVSYTVAWKDPSSSWANGKTVTDYVDVVQNSAGSLTATVNCYKAFGEQVIVKCASVDAPSVFATCVVDYMRRPTSVDFYTLNAGAEGTYRNGLNFGKPTPFHCGPDNMGTGTVSGIFSVTTMTLELSETYVWAAVRNNHYFKEGLAQLGMSAGAFVPKTSIPLTINSADNSFSLSNFRSLYTINGNSALSSYVDNALYEVLSSYTGSGTSFGGINVEGTYSNGDVSVSLEGSCTLNSVDCSLMGIINVALDKSEIVF